MKRMSEFRTVVQIPATTDKISYNSSLLFFGSCFSENIGERFVERRFNAAVNPFGILYNPASVKQGLDILMDNRQFDETMLFEYRGLWNSFYHHSRFSSPDRQEVLRSINEQIVGGGDKLANADYLFVTFGTSWVYEHIEEKVVVANCHKLSAATFNRYRLAVDEIVSSYDELIAKLKEFNPELKIVFTVSPVRHWKDGAHGNQLSKSVLLLAIDLLVSRFENVNYFPAYELVIDDLRDYRFYDEDMLHPNKQAVDYIWQKIQETSFDESAKDFVKTIEKVVRARSHRPFNPDTEEYRTFVHAEVARIKKMMNEFPEVNFENDLSFFNSIISD